VEASVPKEDAERDQGMMAALGVRRTQLYELLRKLGLDIRALREGGGEPQG
jgi:hypothetical protein